MGSKVWEKHFPITSGMQGVPHGVTGYTFRLSVEGAQITQHLGKSNSIVMLIPPDVHIAITEFEEKAMGL
jgi:hypothetical protein